MSEKRDFVLARLAIARGNAASVVDALDSCLSLFIFPTEDKDGSERAEALDIISEAAGDISRSIEKAQAALEGMDKKELNEVEPDDDDDEEESDSDGDEDAA